jgi:hypothetical protein
MLARGLKIDVGDCQSQMSVRFERERYFNLPKITARNGETG